MSLFWILVIPQEHHQHQNKDANIQLFKNNALGLTGTLEWRVLQKGSASTTTVRLVGPTSLTAIVAKLACCLETTWFALSYQIVS